MSTSSNKSRRSILKGGAATGVLVAAETQGNWITPVVRSITVPAHASTTQVLPCAGDVTCVGTPPSGTEVTETQELTASFTVVPNPGVPVLITFTATCDDGLSSSGVFELETEADGTIQLFAEPAGEGCFAGSLIGLEGRCGQGAIGRCEWPVVAGATIAPKAPAGSGASTGPGWRKSA